MFTVIYIDINEVITV